MEETQSARRTVKILCLSDLHIGRPMPVLRQTTGGGCREDTEKAFCELMARVDEIGAQIVIFGGNLVDKAYFTNEIMNLLVRSFAERESCHFVVTPGPEDYFEKQGLWRSKRWPKNVHVFSDEVLGSIHFEDLRVSVYGWGYRGRTSAVSPFLGTHSTPKGYLSVLCGRTDLLGAESSCCPVSEEDLAGFGADYIALSGKPHDGFRAIGNSICAYSGAFQSETFGEDEGGTYVELTAEAGESGWALRYERKKADTYRYAEVALDVSHVGGSSVASDKIRALFQKKGYDEKTAVLLHLTGNVSPDTAFYGWEAAEFGVYALRVSDETLPLDGAEHLLHEMTAAGELYRHFYDAMIGGDAEEKRAAARSFRVGYAALLGKDFTRF